MRARKLFALAFSSFLVCGGIIGVFSNNEPYEPLHSLDAEFVEGYPCISEDQNGVQSSTPISKFKQTELEKVAVCGELTSSHATAIVVRWYFNNQNKLFARSSTARDVKHETGFHSFNLLDALKLSEDLPGYHEIENHLENGFLPPGWYRVEAHVGRKIIGEVNFEVIP